MSRTLLSPFILLFLLTSPISANEEVPWMDIESAIQQADKNHNFVYIDLYADWCLPCKQMDKVTFRDSLVVQMLSQNFSPVRLNAESEEMMPCDGWSRKINECLIEYWGINGVPTSIILSPDGMYIFHLTQFMDPTTFLQFLNDVNGNKEEILKGLKEALAAEALEKAKMGPQ